jgi:hypothetical protein
MRQLRAFLSRLNAPLLRERHDRDLALELDAHVQMLTDDNIRAGVSPEEARRQARIALGGVESVKENCRDRRGLPLLESLSQDLSYAFRILRRSPGFTLVALTTLALGLGATTAIFTLIDAVLLKSLPVRDPGALVVLGDGRGSGVTGSGQSGSCSLLNSVVYSLLLGPVQTSTRYHTGIRRPLRVQQRRRPDRRRSRRLGRHATSQGQARIRQLLRCFGGKCGGWPCDRSSRRFLFRAAGCGREFSPLERGFQWGPIGCRFHRESEPSGRYHRRRGAAGVLR